MTDGRHPIPGCLDAETLAAFMDGRLEPRERAAVEAHLADCEDCYEVWMEARAVAPAPAIPKTSGSQWQWLSAAAAVLLVAAGVAYFVQSRGDRPELKELVAAVEGPRATDGRLTGGFPWASRPSANRSSDAFTPPAAVALAAARLQLTAEADGSARNLAAFATGQLHLQTPAAIQRAVEALEQATALAPDVAEYWSDLGAAYLARYRAAANAVDVPQALEAIETALTLAPNLVEARFNHAVTLAKLGRRAEAVTAWKAYLEADPASAWTDEARQALKALEEGIAGEREHPQPSALRQQLFDEVLTEWATTTGAPTMSSLRRATDLAAALKPYDDRLAEEALASLQTAEYEVANRAGLKAYGTARRHYRGQRFAEAVAAFAMSEPLLRASRNPLEYSAAAYHATSLYMLGDIERAVTDLAKVRETIQDRSYHSVLGRVEWMLGLITLARGDFAPSDRHYHSAARAFERAGERDNQAFMKGLLAERSDRMGDPVAAWADRLEALALDDRNGNLLAAGTAARLSGWPHTAARLQREAIRRAEEARDTPGLVDALRELATTRVATPEARALLERANALLDDGDPSWTRMRAEVDLGWAHSASDTDLPAGLAAAGRALAYFEQASLAGRVPEVLQARARLHRLAGHGEDARQDLHRALALLERAEGTIDDGTQRQVAGDLRVLIGDELAALEFEVGDTQAAWHAVVRSRSLAPSVSQPGTELLATASLPSGRTVLHYATTKTAVFIWAIGRGGPAFGHSVVAIDELRRLVLAYQGSHQPAIGARLSQLLIQPIASALKDGEELRIVPDGPLHQLPFGALPGSHHRYLVEEHPIAVWPDVAAALRIPAPAAPAGSPSMTAIGNPLPAGRHEFADLPDAETEARQVADLYDGATLLLGPAATVGGVSAALKTRAIVHIASHAVADRLAPDRSRLLLAGGSTLTARELRSGRFGAELVVLASCDSAVGRLTRSGPLGLAQALLGAGVPRIVAGYWAVDDRASAALFREFHLAYRLTRDAAVALRTAQIALIRSGDPELSHPRRWAALGLYAS